MIAPAAEGADYLALHVRDLNDVRAGCIDFFCRLCVHAAVDEKVEI